jgi:hypothetical protein
MPRTELPRSIALASALIASTTLIACNDSRRTARASTTVAEAQVSTNLPASEVSDEFLLATATVAAEAASVPHPVAAAVVVPPRQPPPSDAAANQAAPAAHNASGAAGNAH